MIFKKLVLKNKNGKMIKQYFHWSCVMSFGYLSLQLCRIPGVRIVAEPKDALHFKVDYSALSNTQEKNTQENKIEHHWIIRHISKTEDELLRYSPNHNALSTVHESYVLPWGKWPEVLEHIKNPQILEQEKTFTPTEMPKKPNFK